MKTAVLFLSFLACHLTHKVRPNKSACFNWSLRSRCLYKNYLTKIYYRPLLFFILLQNKNKKDILADPRCSLTVAAKEFKGAADGRVNLMGNCERVKDEEEVKKCKEIYLQKHPGE